MEEYMCSMFGKLHQMEELLHVVKEDLLKYRKMIDQINETSHKDEKMIQQNKHNKEELHMTSVESLEGEQMEEELKFVVPDLGEDQISELPETVLHHILSYLPTKDSIRTSLVAKRWRYLWKAVPTLDFQFSMERGRLRKHNHKKFLDFVDKVFMFRDSIALSRFCLSYVDYGEGGTLFESCFKLWIEAIARLKVNFLELDFYTPVSSLQLSTMETLEMLRLVALTGQRQKLHLHSLSGLHHLKILKLERVDSSLGEFSTFPTLMELHLKEHRFEGGLVLNISLPSLRILNVIQDYAIQYCEIRISVPCLKSFFLKGRNYFVFDGLCSLSKLVIADNSSDPSCIRRLCKIVTASTHLKIFFWQYSNFMWSKLVENLRACVAPPFANMKQLCLHLYCCNCDDYVDSVIYLLENCTNLEKLVVTGFEWRSDLGEHRDKNCKPAKDPPKFTHPSLKEIEVSYNRRDCVQREWVQLLNRCSPCLKLKRYPMNKCWPLKRHYFRLPAF
ncbi:hypothetical protein H6P81_019348 [Aristolochia fimbriata]|uniref:F-box domain-containing protein n=1 Tax=Aristolochia fimbriata TaxID=158543 RepID=A0AAV7DSA4_ARIFI|nr:hypothetical protein H6P81_019348 [Aristolochia fimbriata]